eukprot:TRINITY_DN73_c0_g1_i10.p1 TRINITY_DN73_c0_g1~~TRINITY_DN73_c0_g1_i10.p1  ORF type:complete len:557 (+),score=121.64 TRINITY_DN73_c0_g1_i10:95-1765(+)
MEENKKIFSDIGQMGQGIQKLIHVQTETIKHGLVGIGNIVKTEGTGSKDAILELQDAIAELSDVITSNHEELMKTAFENKACMLREKLGMYQMMLENEPPSAEAHGKILFRAIADKQMGEKTFIELVHNVCEEAFLWNNPEKMGLIPLEYAIFENRNEAFEEILRLKMKKSDVIQQYNGIPEYWYRKFAVFKVKSFDEQGKLMMEIFESDEPLAMKERLFNEFNENVTKCLGLSDFNEWIPTIFKVEDNFEAKKAHIELMLKPRVDGSLVSRRTVYTTMKIFGDDMLEYLLTEEVDVLPELKMSEHIQRLYTELKMSVRDCLVKFFNLPSDVVNKEANSAWKIEALRLVQTVHQMSLKEGLNPRLHNAIGRLFYNMSTRLTYVPFSEMADIKNTSTYFAFDDKLTKDAVQLFHFNRAAKSIKETATGSFLDIGISTGKFSWTFQQRHGYNMCFGVTEMPVSTWRYDQSASNAHVLNINDGRIYSKGVRGKSKIKDRNMLANYRFHLDMDKGECRLSINSKDKGIIFSGLTGTQYPFVAFSSTIGDTVYLSNFDWDF